MSDTNQNRVDAYLRGEMTQEQRLEFERDLQTDTKLREDLRLTKEIAEALSERREKMAMMARWEKEAKMADRISHRNLTIRRWTIGLSAAACLAVGFFAVKPFMTTNTGNDFTMPSFDVPYMRSSPAFTHIDSLIEDKNYKLALQEVDSLCSVGRVQEEEYAEKDSLSERDNYKLDILKSDQYELEWRRINLLMALGEEGKAKVELSEFVNMDGNHREEAIRLLDSLK